MDKYYYVYILTNKKQGVLYVGVTNDLVRRVWEHRQEKVDGFTKEYNLKHLIYYEVASDINSAILREKKIKKWNRSWKIRLIEKSNPEWVDLYKSIC